MKTITKRIALLLLALCLCLPCGCKKSSDDLSDEVGSQVWQDAADEQESGEGGNASEDDKTSAAASDAKTSSQQGTTSQQKGTASQNGGGATGTVSTAVIRKNGKRQPDTDTAELTAMKKALNFGGKELVIMFEWAPVTQMGYGHGANYDSQIKRFEDLQTKYNVKLNLKKCATSPYGQAVTTSIMSGSPNANIYMVGTGFVTGAVKANLLADMTDAMNKTGITMDASYYNTLSTQIGNVNGHQYEMGAGQRIGGYIIYNKTILKSLNLEDPQVLMKNRQWTWAKLTKMAEAATVRDKNGAVTRYGLGMSMYGENFVGLVLSNGGHIINVDSKGKLVNNINSNAVRQTMDQIYQWGQKKILTINYGQVAWQALDDDFLAGKIAFMYGQTNTISQAIYSMKDDFGVAYMPMGPSAKNYVSYIYDDYGYVVPITYQKNMQDYLLLLDDLVKPRTKDDFRTEWVTKFQTSADYKTFKAMYDGTITQRYDYGHMVGITDLPGLADGSRTASSIIDANINKINNSIKDNFGSMTFARYGN